MRAVVESLRDELISLRRDFHMHPELGFEEIRTSRVIYDYLAKLDLEVQFVAGTGVSGLLRGYEPGPTLMLRSDIDALPIYEATCLSFASRRPGVMHACGHDGHIAMLLVAAKILSAHRDRIRGNVKFVFQPNEEEAGAQVLVEEGVLKDPDVDAALAIHLWSPLPSGTIGVAAGPVMASSEYFDLTIRGCGGHGGAPHEAIDPILCAADVISGVQAVQTRETSVLKPTLITFCQVRAGTSPIIVPGEVEMAGSIRCLHEDAERVKAAFDRMVESICEAHQAKYDLRIVLGNSMMVNDVALARLVREVAEEVVAAGVGAGPDRDGAGVEPGRVTDDVRMMVGEDFAEFARLVPGVMYFVGTGGPVGRQAFPHHHPRFDIDEETLLTGVEMHVQTALRYLGVR